MSRNAAVRAVLVACLLLALVACGQTQALTHAAPSAGTDPGPPALAPPSAVPTPSASTDRRLLASAGDDRYLGLAGLLHARGVRIWWESDLVARWLEGPASFSAAVQRLGVLAEQPGTMGFKVADEIGYNDGLSSPSQALNFLRDARHALDRVAPGKEILVDAVVLELGCVPRTEDSAICARRARRSSPAASIDAVTAYLREGLVDRLDLSTGLGAATAYPDDDLAAAQDVAWAYVATGSWPGYTHLQSRKALASAGGYRGDADADLRVFVAVPQRHGARATDIWTWRQTYQDQTVSLFGPNPKSNPLWAPLKAARDRGVQLFTHMTPSSLPTGAGPLAHECDLAAQVFSDVLVAAGTG